MVPSKEDMHDALVLRQGKELTEKFEKTTVAICGLGGLGSNIAISLARAGIGKLILIDFDIVDVTNLHRQQYKASQVGMTKAEAIYENLLEISPYTTYETHNIKLTEDNIYELLKDADIICEAFDKAEQKAMLNNTVLTTFKDKYLVSASGMAGMDDPNIITTRKITSKFYLCGDGISDVNDNISLVAPRVMLCAAHEAHTVLRIIQNNM